MFFIIILAILILYFLMVWGLAHIANKIYPRFDLDQYILVLFFAPLEIKLILVLLAFITPDFGRTIDLKAAYTRAQFTTSLKKRDQVETNAAADVKKIILKYYPLGSDIEPLIKYLTKSGLKCEKYKIKEDPFIDSTCYYEYNKFPMGQVKFIFKISTKENNKLSDLNIKSFYYFDFI